MTHKQRGDTLIEVILASSILALVSVSMFTIMQRLSTSAYESLERTQTRMIMNRQSELLRYLRDQYVIAKTSGVAYAPTSPAGLWDSIRTASATGIPASDSCTSSAPAQSFYIKRSGSVYTTVVGLPVMPQLAPTEDTGIWIQKVDPTGYATMANKFHDFYVMACWTTATSQQQTLSTIVRLYEPNL